MKQYLIKFSDNDDYEYHSQKVWSDNEDGRFRFRVSDLTDCPEDATIDRDLFCGHDFIRAVELGFRIAKLGYDEIIVEDVPWED